jgi:hypothetical protein
MVHTKSAPASASTPVSPSVSPAQTAPTPAPTPTPPSSSPADRPPTDTSASPKVLHPPKNPAPADKKSLTFQDFINDANSSDDDRDTNPRARKLQWKAMFELMPVINLSSQTFAPIGEERPKTPPTPVGKDADADAMDLDGKAPAALGGVPPGDIFGDSDDEHDVPQEPPTWGGG